MNPDRIAVLAIAFHNLGVELEHLKRVIDNILKWLNYLLYWWFYLCKFAFKVWWEFANIL